MVFNKNNKKEISAIEDLIKAKVYVNPTRFNELSLLKEKIWRPDTELPVDPCSLLCINLSPAVEDALRNLRDYTLQVEHISEDPADPLHKQDRKRFTKLFGGKKLEEGRVGAVLHELKSEDDQLSLLDRRVIALSLLNRLPVLVLSCRSPLPLLPAHAASGSTWPVFHVANPQEDMSPVRQWLLDELPRVRALSAAVETELQDRVAHLAKVNAPLHFLKRATVALVPFGVLTVNFLGVLRLMATILGLVGMRGDTSANKALGMLGAKNAALVSAIDSLGDVYSFAIFATVLADLQAMGLVEAAAAMDVLDGLMLGSISVVTGAVSALGAYLSRPLVVRAAASFLASLQTIAVMNPDMKRLSERRPSRREADGKAGMIARWRRRRRGGDGGGEGKGVEEGLELQCLRVVKEGEGPLGGRGGGGEGSDSESKEEEEEGKDSDSEDSDEEGGEEGGGGGDGGGVDVAGTDAAMAGCGGGGEPVVIVIEGKQQQQMAAAARRQAAAEAKEVNKAAKAAAKAEKAAKRQQERELKAALKQERRERKAAEKVAKRQRRAEIKAAARKAKEKKGVEGSEDVGDGGGGNALAAAAEGTGVPAKEPWWRKKKGSGAVADAAAAAAGEAVMSGVEGMTGGQGAGGGEGGAAGPSGSGLRSISSTCSEGGEGEGGTGADSESDSSSVAEGEVLGLDEATCRGLLEFLALKDEEVYDSSDPAVVEG